MDHCIEETLWSAMRALEEGALFMRHLSAVVEPVAVAGGGPDFSTQAAEAHRHADMVREVVQLRQR